MALPCCLPMLPPSAATASIQADSACGPGLGRVVFRCGGPGAPPGDGAASGRGGGKRGSGWRGIDSSRAVLPAVRVDAPRISLGGGWAATGAGGCASDLRDLLFEGEPRDPPAAGPAAGIRGGVGLPPEFCRGGGCGGRVAAVACPGPRTADFRSLIPAVGRCIFTHDNLPFRLGTAASGVDVYSRTWKVWRIRRIPVPNEC